MNSLNDLISGIKELPDHIQNNLKDESEVIDLITTLQDTDALVPKEPTDKMALHGAIAAGIIGILWSPEDYKRVYKAMLSSAEGSDS